MKAMLTTMFTLLPGLANAHPGHLAEIAGHGHAVAGGAIGVAVGVAIWSVLKGRKNPGRTDEPDADAADENQQEA